MRRQPRRSHSHHNRVIAGEHDIDDHHRNERAHLVQIRQHAGDISTESDIVEGTGNTITVGARGSRAVAVRLSLLYAASFLVVGIQLPFWPVWLSGRGFDAHEI